MSIAAERLGNRPDLGNAEANRYFSFQVAFYYANELHQKLKNMSKSKKILELFQNDKIEMNKTIATEAVVEGQEVDQSVMFWTNGLTNPQKLAEFVSMGNLMTQLKTDELKVVAKEISTLPATCTYDQTMQKLGMTIEVLQQQSNKSRHSTSSTNIFSLN